MKYLLFASALLICISIAGPSYPAGIDRIVIAPAISETAIALKLALRGARDEAREEAQEFYFFYGTRSFEPLWIEEQPSQKWMVNDRYRMLRTLISAAASLGLNPNDYRLPSNPNLSLSEAVDLEMATSAMALRFGRDNYGGRLDPRSVSPNLDMDRPTPDRTQLFQILASPDPASALANLAPDSPEFRSLLNLLNDDTGGPPAIEIGPGAALRPDAVDTRVPLLRARLSLVEATQDSNRYDATLVKAVRKFQRLQGLIVDGIVGDATREALNRQGSIGRAQILVNLERWRWLPRERGTSRVEVNIPEFRLRVIRDETVAYESRVVVGTKTNQTPIFYDEIRHVVVNPYWNVPISIVRSEIAPSVRSDPTYLGRSDFELIQGGNIIDPLSVDWSRLSPGAFPFSVRQRPGSLNALGQVKFLFPNKHAVYLHDTPEKSLFGRDVRAFSHGCIRVQNPFDFADALLATEPNLGKVTLTQAFGPKERWFNLEVSVPVFLTYFTLRIDGAGQVVAYADIYGHDERIAKALDLL